MDKQMTLATAVVVSLGTVSAEAAVWSAQLVGAGAYGNSGLSNLNITSSTAIFSYDDATGLLTQTGGTFNGRATTVFRQSMTGVVLGNGAAASAATFVCAEGNLGSQIGAHICGNYLLGDNFLNESTVTWGPGTSASRTLGGDDEAAGPQRTIAGYDGMTTISWVGTTLVIGNGACTGVCTLQSGGGFNTGYQWTLQTTPVPVPAAAWLFGAALAVVGGLRRRLPAGGPG